MAKDKHSAPTRQSIVDLDTKLKTLQTRVQYSQADLKVSNEKLNQFNQQKGLKDDLERDLRVEIEGLKKEIVKLEKRLSTLVRHTREVEMRVFGTFSASVGVDNIRCNAIIYALIYALD
jgi:chromosome segregation ATPase